MTDHPSAPLFLGGARCNLRPLEEADYVGGYRHWVSDREVTRFLFRGALPVTEADARQMFAAATANPRVDLEVAITLPGETRAIGIVGLHSINWVARHAEFRILIGDRSAWGRGVGSEACELMVAYGFEVLNMEKIWLGVTGANLRAATSYRKVGFVEEGVLRNEIWYRGRYDDVIRMSLLKEEYRAAVGSWNSNALVQAQLCAQR